MEKIPKHVEQLFNERKDVCWYGKERGIYFYCPIKDDCRFEEEETGGYSCIFLAKA